MYYIGESKIINPSNTWIIPTNFKFLMETLNSQAIQTDVILLWKSGIILHWLHLAPRDFFGWEILISASISQGVIGVLKLLIWYWLNFGGWYRSKNLSVSFRLLSFVCLTSYFFTCFTSVEFSLVSLFYFQVLNYLLHFITLLVCVFKEVINGKNSCYLWEDLISRTQRSKR